MPVTYVGQQTGITSNGTTVAFSYTTGSGADRLLLAGISAARTVSSASYAGAAMTTEVGSGARQIMRLVNPASGAQTFSLTLTSYGSAHKYSLADFDGVDQTTPLGAGLTPTGTSNTPSTGTVTVPADGAAFGFFYHGYATTTPTINTGTLTGASTNGSTCHGGGYRTTTGAIAWNINKSSSWTAFALPINPSGGGPSFVAAHLPVISQAIGGMY